MTIKKELIKFSQETSCHGFAHIANTTNAALQVFWGLLVVGCAIFIVFYINQLVKKFNSHPVNVQSEIKFDRLPFPAVTICNLNPIRKSKISLVPALEKLLSACDLATNKKNVTATKPEDFCKTRRGSYRGLLPKGNI